MKQFNAMMPGGTYRVTYRASEGQLRTALAMYHGLVIDDIVANPDTGKMDKQAYHFSLMSPNIYDHAAHKDFVIDAPAHVEITLDLWVEDIVSTRPAMKTTDA